MSLSSGKQNKDDDEYLTTYLYIAHFYVNILCLIPCEFIIEKEERKK
jgi:hypothetical protein